MRNFQLKYIFNFTNGQGKVQVVGVKCFLDISKYGFYISIHLLKQTRLFKWILRCRKRSSTLRKIKTNLNRPVSAFL